MLKLLVEIARRAGVDCDEGELAALTASTNPNRLAAQIEALKAADGWARFYKRVPSDT